MKKARDFSQANGTSFHHDTINARPSDLIRLAERLGSKYCENNTGENKTNFDFIFKTSQGHIFTVYDWKEYRALNEDEVIKFNIGAKNAQESNIAKHELLNEI